jgi:hypothetical protein
MSGYVKELARVRWEEIANLKAQIETLTAEHEQFKRDIDGLARAAVAEAYQKGQEDMRESAAELMEIQSPHLFTDPDWLAGKVRALPIKEAALSAKEGEK